MDAPTKAGCTHIPSCELFPKFGLRGALGVWQTFYCQGNFRGCARYQRALRGEPVSPNLLPNGKELDLERLGIAR